MAGGRFLGFCLVPFVTYPADPPAIGHGDTIEVRTGLHLIMVVCSITLLATAAGLGRRLQGRIDGPGFPGFHGFPGFLVDVLFTFRCSPVAAQPLLWSAIALVFGPPAERGPGAAPTGRTARAPRVGPVEA